MVKDDLWANIATKLHLTTNMLPYNACVPPAPQYVNRPNQPDESRMYCWQPNLVELSSHV